MHISQAEKKITRHLYKSMTHNWKQEDVMLFGQILYSTEPHVQDLVIDHLL